MLENRIEYRVLREVVTLVFQTLLMQITKTIVLQCSPYNVFLTVVCHD